MKLYKPTVEGDITADAFVTNSGTAAMFVKGDGSLDTNTYLSDEIIYLSGTTADRLALTGASLPKTGQSYWDTTLMIPCYYFNTVWYNAAGGVIT